MITGAHMMIYSKDPKKDTAFFKDVLKFPYVSVGDGWLIFGLPPTEMMIGTAAKEKEADGNANGDDACQGGLSAGSHQLFLMCDSMEKFVEEAKELGVDVTEPEDKGWGIEANFMLPGGSKFMIYEPRHEKPTYPQQIDILTDAPQDNEETVGDNGKSNRKQVSTFQEGSKKAKRAKASESVEVDL